MDILSEILSSLDVEATAIAHFSLGTPWAMDADSFAYVFCYHVIEGTCWITPKGGNTRQLCAGDCVLGPHGGSFTLTSSEGLPATPVGEIWAVSKLPHIKDGTLSQPITLRWGGDGPRTRLLALAFTLKRSTPQALLHMLPDIIYTDAKHCEHIPWLRSTTDFLAAEGNGPIAGYGAIAGKLAALLFAGLVRAYALDDAAHPPGWLHAASDKKITKALAIMHADQGRPLSIAILAKEAGMSRSAFSKLFKDVTGQSPQAYLASWRMHLAAARLRHDDVQIRQLADAFGYHSERVFRRTFKQYIGQSPREFRRCHTI